MRYEGCGSSSAALRPAGRFQRSHDAGADGDDVAASRARLGYRGDGLLRNFVALRPFAADVLTCNSCGARRKVLAFISHLPTARRILEHLQLPQGLPPVERGAIAPQLVFEPLECA